MSQSGLDLFPLLLFSYEKMYSREDARNARQLPSYLPFG